MDANLWVKFKNNPTKVPTQECDNVDHFSKACKKELSNLLGSYAPGQFSLSTTEGGTPLEPDDPLPDQNTGKTPLFISVYVEKQDPTREPPRRKYCLL